MFVVQDTTKTKDIYIPNRKRGDFIEAVKKGRSAEEQAKVLYAVVDREKALDAKVHSGVHSKVLIVDDEIVLLGSGNVNQRSFTLDSETSVILIDQLFAFAFRVALWDDYFLKNYNDWRFSDWRFIPKILRNPNHIKNYSEANILKECLSPDAKDMDKEVIEWLLKDKLGWVARTLVLNSPNLQKNFLDRIYSLDPTKKKHKLSDIYNKPENTVPELFDIIWENVIDPKN